MGTAWSSRTTKDRDSVGAGIIRLRLDSQHASDVDASLVESSFSPGVFSRLKRRRRNDTQNPPLSGCCLSLSDSVSQRLLICQYCQLATWYLLPSQPDRLVVISAAIVSLAAGA